MVVNKKKFELKSIHTQFVITSSTKAYLKKPTFYTFFIKANSTLQ